MDLDFPVDQFGLISVHFLKNRKQQILAQLDGRPQNHVEHLTVVFAVVFIFRQ